MITDTHDYAATYELPEGWVSECTCGHRVETRHTSSQAADSLRDHLDRAAEPIRRDPIPQFIDQGDTVRIVSGPFLTDQTRDLAWNVEHVQRKPEGRMVATLHSADAGTRVVRFSELEIVWPG